MNIRDRTSEFQRSVITYKKLHNKATAHSSTSHNNYNNELISNEGGNANKKISEFQKRASDIAKEISQTAQLLSKLAILAKRKPMFNDNPVEIAELSFLIKRKIYSIEQQLLSLSQLSNNNNKNNNNNSNYYGNDTNNNTKKHSHNVVNLLNRKMKNMSGDFKTVLEERQKLELSNRDRWGRINEMEKNKKTTATETGDNNASNNNNNNNNNDENIENANRDIVGYNSSNPFMSSLIEETEATQQQHNNNQLSVPNSDQQLLLMEEGLTSQDNLYLQERNRAVETIETTIQEVGNLFQQLASMVQEQGEVIQRIDANVDDVDLNISGAQRELLKYFDRVKSNRWLAAKIFFIIFCFFLVWVLVN